MVYKYKGDVAWCMSKLDLALECYSKSIEINQECSSAYLNKAILLSELDRYSEAISCHDVLLSLNPNNSLSMTKKKEVYYSLNKNKVNSLHSLRKDDVLNSVFYYEKARSLTDHKLALEYLRVALEIDPKYEDAIRLMAAIFCDANEFAKCIEYCDLLFKLDKYCEDMHVFEMKIESLFNLRFRLCEAKRFAEKALRIDAQNHKIKRIKQKIMDKMESYVYGY